MARTIVDSIKAEIHDATCAIAESQWTLNRELAEMSARIAAARASTTLRPDQIDSIVRDIQDAADELADAHNCRRLRAEARRRRARGW